MCLRWCFVTLVFYAVCISYTQAQGYFDDDETVTCGALEFQCDERCLPRSLFCNNIFDCEDQTDEKYCSSVSYQSQCPSNWLKCSSQSRCIPENWICNGFKDCSYNNDETSCSSADLSRESLDESVPKKNLIKWFLRRRKSGSTTNKWGHELPRTAVALFLGDRDFFVQNKNKTMEEMSYELSIQLLSDISRDRQVRKNDLATFIHALLVTCIDPRDFHGKDLVSELRRKVEDSTTAPNPFDILALCNAGDKMTEKDVERIAAAYNNRSRPFWIDNQAMATIALACIYNTSDLTLDERTLIDMEKDLKKRQFRNGTVENIKTTALVVQALIATQSHMREFDLEAAIHSIVQSQHKDGSIGSFLESYYILPTLSNSSLLDINSKHCERPTTSEEEALSEFQRTRGEKMSTQLSVWVGSGTDIKRSWTLRVPVNSSLYHIMETANRLDTRQRIAYNVINGKPYVSSLIGLQDDIEMGNYWYVYVRELNSGEDPKLVDKSPVDVKIEPNQELIMWYKSS